MNLDLNKIKLALSALAVMFSLNTSAQKQKAPTPKHKTTVVVNTKAKKKSVKGGKGKKIVLGIKPLKTSGLLAMATDVATSSDEMENFNILKDYAKFRTEEFIESAYHNFVEAASTGSDQAVYKMYKIKNKRLHCAETTRKIMEKTIKEGHFTEIEKIFKGYTNSAPVTGENLYDLCRQGGTYPDYIAQIKKDMAESEVNGGIWFVVIKSPQNRRGSGYHAFTVVAKDGVAYRCNFNRTWIKNIEEENTKSAIVINMSRELYDEIINQHMTENSILPLASEEMKYLEQKENKQSAPANIREDNKEVAQAEQRVRNRLAALLLQNSKPADVLAQEAITQSRKQPNIDISKYVQNQKIKIKS